MWVYCNYPINKRNSSNSSKRKELSCRRRRWSLRWLVHGRSGIIEKSPQVERYTSIKI